MISMKELLCIYSLQSLGKQKAILHVVVGEVVGKQPVYEIFLLFF